MSAPARVRSPFRALSVAILRGFLRDRASVFFAIIFPLMFLVLFGGLLANQSQPKVDLIQVGSVPFIDDLPEDAAGAFDQTFKVTRTSDLAAALAKVRKGDADVAVEQRGGEVIAHYTQTDQVKAAVTQGTLQAFVDGVNVAASGRPPAFRLVTERVEDDSLTTIQFVTPGLLGWAVAMSAASRVFHVESSSRDGAVPIKPGWTMPVNSTPGTWREVAFCPEKSQTALYASGNCSVRNPPPLRLAKIPV